MQNNITYNPLFFSSGGFNNYPPPHSFNDDNQLPNTNGLVPYITNNNNHRQNNKFNPNLLDIPHHHHHQINNFYPELLGIPHQQHHQNNKFYPELLDIPHQQQQNNNFYPGLLDIPHQQQQNNNLYPNPLDIPYQHQQNYNFFSESNIPPAYKFTPTLKQLILDYLIPKNENKLKSKHERLFPEVDVYAQSPMDLVQGRPLLNTLEQVWYFMSKRTLKYPMGNRPSRKAGDGYWKLSGKEVAVTVNGKQIGVKTVLDYLTGNHPRGRKTFWKMHEYVCKEKNATAKIDDWVICKIYYNERGSKKQKAEEAQEEPQTQHANKSMEMGQHLSHVHEVSNQTSLEDFESAQLPPNNFVASVDELLWYYNNDKMIANQSIHSDGATYLNPDEASTSQNI